MVHKTAARTLTFSIQDYVKSIYDLTAAGKPATTTAIARRLNVSPASVTGMLQKLASAKPPLVSYKKRQGARLTESGERAALEVIRHHRLLETWLVHTLGYSWDDVHGEAERLEHALSEELEARISRALGNPARDPHGEPIPTSELVMPRDESVPLSALRAGQEAIVRRVQPHATGALPRLMSMGIQIGSRVKVIGISSYDRLTTLRVQSKRRNVTLGPALTGQVYVETIDSKIKGTRARE
ncbi:MAG TPA: metal-dependent transcriptional regulator [Anaerolineales bacterium]